MFTSDMLETFVQVAERASFTAAAVEADIAKGVVSKRIGQLESQLGHPLFRRTTRRVHLTPAGEIFLDVARKVLNELAAGAEALSSLRNEPAGSIRVTTSISWGTEVLARLIPKFLHAYPRIEVDLILSDSIMDLATERIDLALRMTSAPSPNQVAVSLVGLKRLLCASPKYLKAFGTPKKPADLTTHSCLGYWSGIGQQSWTLLRRSDRKTIPIHGRYRVNNPNAVKDAVMAGLGIGLLPEYMCARELEAGKLIRVLSDWTPETPFGDGVYAVGLPERIRSSRCQALLNFLKEELGGPVNPSASRLSRS